MVNIAWIGSRLDFAAEFRIINNKNVVEYCECRYYCIDNSIRAKGRFFEAAILSKRAINNEYFMKLYEFDVLPRIFTPKIKGE